MTDAAHGGEPVEDAGRHHATGTPVPPTRVRSPGTSSSPQGVWRRLSPGRVGLGLAAWIALLAVAGLAAAVFDDPVLDVFDLDAEWNIPALSSALLLAAAAAALFRLSFRVPSRAAPFLLSSLLAFAAIDEAAQIHETLEQSLDVDWQKLYLPGAAIAAVAWILLVVQLRSDRRAVVILVSSGALWLGSQVLELVQWDGETPTAHYTTMMVGEELLETTGSALLLLAFLYASDGVQRGAEPATPTRADVVD